VDLAALRADRTLVVVAKIESLMPSRRLPLLARTSSDVYLESAFGTKAENICSGLIPSGLWAVKIGL
jgi:hypothetical protein